MRSVTFTGESKAKQRRMVYFENETAQCLSKGLLDPCLDAHLPALFILIH